MSKRIIYPNPTKDFVNIVVPLSLEYTGVVQIQEMNGNIKYHKEIDYIMVTVNIKSYPVGIYFVKYKSVSGEEMVKKLIITK